MPVRTPLHCRTAQLCEAHSWKTWGGYLSVRRYGVSLDEEYHALRSACTLMDASPLCKLEVRGPDAGSFASYLFTREIGATPIGAVRYGAFCDADGYVIDDGTVARLSDDHYRITSGSTLLPWVLQHSIGFRVEISDSTHTLAALALQGPQSRTVLRGILGSSQIDELGYFHLAPFRIDGIPVQVSRTGYTGDLGYEVWVTSEKAVHIWDALMEEGRQCGLLPMGLDALDTARIEAGYILQDVEYTSSLRASSPRQKSTPFEIGLGWGVKLKRAPFIGQAALANFKKVPPGKVLVGLEVDWDALSALYDRVDLPATMTADASREATPIFRRGLRPVGYCSSRIWSPMLKKFIGLALLEPVCAKAGTKLAIDLLVEHQRHRVPASVAALPFFDPERKRL